MKTEQLASPDGLTAHVASEIRAWMARKRLTRTELARRLEVDDTWVGKRLNGRTEIGLTDLEKIADVLDVEIIDLLPPAKRRGDQATVRYGDDLASVVTGTFAHPDHPIVAAAVPLSRPIIRPRSAHATGNLPPIGERRTAPTGL